MEPYGIEIEMPGRGKNWLITPDMEYGNRGFLVFERPEAVKLSRIARVRGASKKVVDIFGTTWRVSASDCGAGCHCAMRAEIAPDA